MRSVLLLTIASLTACHAPPTPESTAVPVATNAPQIMRERLGSYLVVPSDTTIGGTSPQLTIACSGGKASASFDVVTPPPEPTSLTGNVARLEVDAQTWTVEVSNSDHNNGLWMIRDEGRSRELSARILAGTTVKFRAPDGLGPSDAIEFGLPPNDQAVVTYRRECGLAN